VVGKSGGEPPAAGGASAPVALPTPEKAKTEESTSTNVAPPAKDTTDPVTQAADSKETADLKAVGKSADTVSADKDKADAGGNKEPAANVPNAEDEAKKIFKICLYFVYYLWSIDCSSSYALFAN
jgi:hypothetical protein